MTTVIQTNRTYASYAKAEKAFGIACARLGRTESNVRSLIAATPDGRFAPVVIGLKDRTGEINIPFAYVGVSVMG